MSQFKVGDRVRVGTEADDLMCRPHPSRGRIGTVVKVFDDGDSYELSLDPINYCYGVEELEPA